MIFEILEAGLAVIGFVALVLACAYWVTRGPENAEPVIPDPYRAGLDASARITAAGFEAERELFLAALKANSVEGER